jgi:hypothetical protein
MARKQSRFVLLAGPQQQAGPGTRYIANDGSTTTIKSQAVRFWTYWGAKNFADQNHIPLNAHTYIGREDFTEVDLLG